MRLVFASALLGVGLLLGCPKSAPAADWMSPDGAISVALPDPARFDSTPPEEDVVAMWEAKDGKTRLFVEVTAVPPGSRITKATLEQSLVNSLAEGLKNIRLVDSVVEQRGGRQVYALTMRGDNADGDCLLVLHVCLVNSTVYKVMAAGYGTDPRTHPDASKFISSFTILATHVEIPVAPGGFRPAPGNPGDEVANVSRNMGRVIGILLPLILVLYFVQRGTGKKKPRTPPPLPPRSSPRDEE